MELIFASALTPSDEPVTDFVYDGFPASLVINKTQRLAAADSDFTDIPDRKALRLMSRTSILLSSVMMRAKSVIEQLLQEDPFRVATYCAIDNGSESYSCVHDLLNVAKEDFAEKYRRSRSPKQYLKQLPNLAPAQAGIFLGLVGPLNVFHNSRFGAVHALEQMRSDLKHGLIDAGIVVSANSFEDPLLAYRNRADAGPEKILREGSGILIFKRGGNTDWSVPANFETSYDYGIATPIIELSSKGV